jgi:hypothetical protein
LADFLRAALWKTFARVQRVIFDLRESTKEKHQKSGAQLLTVAAVSPRALEPDELDSARAAVDHLLESGTPTHKAAVGRILAYNVDESEREYCFGRLARLFNDPDEKVRSGISQAFRQMRAVDLVERADWLADYAKSRALTQGLHDFSQYLLEYGGSDVTLTLNLITAALDNPHSKNEKRWYDRRDFIQFVLRADTDPMCGPDVKRRAMDVFDRLMEEYGELAESILAEWDRR